MPCGVFRLAVHPRQWRSPSRLSGSAADEAAVTATLVVVVLLGP
jgi:hypothetical protein